MTAFVFLCAMFAADDGGPALRVLIVHDEAGPMEVFARRFQEKGSLTVVSVPQAKLPDDLAGFAAVYNFVHRPLTPGVEKACLEYARGGGRHILLHHAISSSKRNNPELLRELRSEVPPGRKPAHGFYVEHGTLTLVNLAPQHYITRHGITYPIQAAYPDADGKPVEREAFSLDDTEIFLNLHFPPRHERTTLYGITFRDAEGADFAQPAGGWVMRTGQGYSFYFQAGHEARDFADPTYQQILINCVRWTP